MVNLRDMMPISFARVYRLHSLICISPSAEVSPG